MLRRSTILAIACLGLLQLPPAVAAPPAYTISEITVPGSLRTIVAALNERGQIAGSYLDGEGHWAPFVLTQGVFTYPDTLGAEVMQASDINDAGHIAGHYYMETGHSPRGFSWVHGVTKDVGDLGGVETFADAIDSRNIAYGYSTAHAFASSNGHILDLGGWPESRTHIRKVNAAGVAVGYAEMLVPPFTTSAFMATLLGHDLLPTLGGQNAMALGINRQGVVCGWAENRSGQTHAFRYENGKIADLGTLPGGRSSEAWAINSAGDVVGNSNTDSARGQRAIIIRNGSGLMEDLNTSTHSKAQGWKLEYAVDINDRGEIVGSGHRTGRPAPFLLTPVSDQ